MTKNPGILVVDDEMDVCNFVKSFFEARGFRVIAALNGDEAMSKLLQEKPEIVMLDIKMRYESEGIEYLPKIKERLPSVKVIVITAVQDDDVIQKAKLLGADDYITKPLVLEYLENTVLAKVHQLKQAAP